MWCLNYVEFFIFKELVDGQLQERVGGYVVIVKDSDKFIGSLFQCIIDIVCFGMFMSRVGNVVYFYFCGECFKCGLVIIIQNIDIDFIFWLINIQCGINGWFYYIEVFVISWYY